MPSARGNAPLLLTSLRVNDEMDESAPPLAKKAKRSAPLTRLTAEERAKQFPEDLYADGGMLFFLLFPPFCEHSVDFTHVDTVKDHLKSKKHWKRRSSSSKVELHPVGTQH